MGLNKVGSLWSMRKLLMDDAIGSPENSFIVRFDTTLPSLRNNVKMAIATCNNLDPSLPPSLPWTRKISKAAGWLSCGAARTVSPDWLQKTMTCHSFNCFSIVCAQG